MPSDAPPPDGLPHAPYRPMREPEGGDSSMRNLAIAAVGVAALVMGGVYVMSRHHPAGVPVIEADPGPIRVKPANPGGLQVPGADDSILMNKDGTEADKLAPPPEAPAPQALAQQSMPPPPAPVASAAAPPVAAEVPAPEQPLPVPQLPAAPPPVHALAPPATEPPAPRAGHAQVQLGALDSEAAAYADWRALTHRFADLLAGHQPTIVKVDRDGKTLFRLRTGGFDDIAAATAFCAKLRAKGGDCAIAAF